MIIDYRKIIEARGMNAAELTKVPPGARLLNENEIIPVLSQFQTGCLELHDLSSQLTIPGFKLTGRLKKASFNSTSGEIELGLDQAVLEKTEPKKTEILTSATVYTSLELGTKIILTGDGRLLIDDAPRMVATLSLN